MTNAEMIYFYAPKHIRDHWYISCVGKKQYRSRRAALKGVRASRRLFQHAQKIYECNYCGMFHLTTSGKDISFANIPNLQFKS